MFYRQSFFTKNFLYSTKTNNLPAFKKFDVAQNSEKLKAPELNLESQEKPERVSKILSRCGICSRRQAEKLIDKGFVYFKGKKLTENQLIISSDIQKLKIYKKDAKFTPVKQTLKLYAVNKPRGDPQKRLTLKQFLFEKFNIKDNHLISVGRLDYNSEGLILLTNDGDFARMLELPESKIERNYKVRVFGTLDEKKLIQIRKGVIIKGKQYGPFKAEIIKRQTRNTWLHIKMHTGKNREIRRVMQKLSLRVNRLIRVKYGPYSIKNLHSGEFLEISILPEIKKRFYYFMRNKLKEKKYELINEQRSQILLDNEKKEELDQIDNKKNKEQKKLNNFTFRKWEIGTNLIKKT